MTNPVQEAQQLGQSIWYDNIRRGLLTSGELQRLLVMGVTGVTSNPTIFEKAVAGSTDYDEQLLALAHADGDAEEDYESLALEDIRGAADLLRPVSVAEPLGGRVRFRRAAGCLGDEPAAVGVELLNLDPRVHDRSRNHRACQGVLLTGGDPPELVEDSVAGIGCPRGDLNVHTRCAAEACERKGDQRLLQRRGDQRVISVLHRPVGAHDADGVAQR